MDLAEMVLELFLVAQEAEPGNGPLFERMFVERLQAPSIRIESIPGGGRLYGFASQSGLAHQLDLVAAIDRADVIVELKAHGGAQPKNDLLRFKAATDDYLMGLGEAVPTRPIYRVFGGPGHASRGMRRYAAIHGIAVVEGARWPSSVLASGLVPWSADEAPAPHVQRSLANLVRPVQVVLGAAQEAHAEADGRESRELDAVLDLHDDWSLRLWAELDRGLDVDDPTSTRWAA